jgi:hypothetical protein
VPSKADQFTQPGEVAAGVSPESLIVCDSGKFIAPDDLMERVDAKHPTGIGPALS